MGSVEYAPIEGFPHYMASSDGKILSKYTGRFLKPRVTQFGYEQVTLSEGGVHFVRLVHRVIAQAFIPNPDHKPQVNHIDEVKTNNEVGNLEWVTCKENINHGTKIERGVSTVGLEALRASARRAAEFRKRRVVNVDTGEIYGSVREAADSVGARHYNIVAACRGRYRTCMGYRWAYADDSGVA